MNWLGAEMTEQFTRMDESTQEQWQHIILTTLEAQPRVADHVLFMLGALEGITDGFAINQLQHGLQTAARAEAAGAEDQWVVASLCHDIGKLISVPNHPRIAAEILRPYVDTEVAEVIAAHQDFQGKHYFAHVGLDPNAREAHRHQPWFALAERFADEWDQNSFDPAGPTPPLAHFEPRVREIFSTPRTL